MFGSAQFGAKAYASVSIETGIEAATPHRLIDMLYEGALLAIANGRQQMENGNIPLKGASISKAIMIIDNGLRASLDKNVGGDIALNLYALYEYMSKRLLIANYKNDPAILDEVRDLLNELHGAWRMIDPQAAVNAAASSAANAPASARLTKV